MIKKIFRTKLRVYLYKNIGEVVNFEDAFSWVYTSPIWEWKLRVLCICNTTFCPIIDNKYLPRQADLEKASELWKFFHE